MKKAENFLNVWNRLESTGIGRNIWDSWDSWDRLEKGGIDWNRLKRLK